MLWNKITVMKLFSKSGLIFLVILPLFFAGCEKSGRESKIIPVEDFFRNPANSSFRLSPSGEYISFLKPYSNGMNIFVLRIGMKDTVRLTGYSDRGIDYHFWANDSKIVFARDSLGNEKYRLYSINIDGTGLKQLTGEGNSTAGIIDPLVDNEDEMIISLNDRDESARDVYRLNINTGRRKLIAKNPGSVSRWLTDNNGKLRVAQTSDGVNSGILYRESEDEPFRLSMVTNFKEMLQPIAFTFDNKLVYAVSNLNRDRSALVIYDIVHDREVDVLFEHFNVDIEHVFFSRKKKKVTGVSYVDWKTEFEFFDDGRYELQKLLESLIPDREVWITETNRDESKMLVRCSSDRAIGEYYYYDSDDDELIKLADLSPWLSESELSPMKPVTYKSRDGLAIHGYLTIPLNKKAKNLPTVILPHGGPWARDKWGYDAEVQMLSNRGYAVLQMNYRGSFGYGKEFWEAGFGEWGLKMQDDITDGVNWLVQQGIADPNRVGIYGFSFGGYCALQGVVRTPELYRCAVSLGGLNNILYFVKSVPPHMEQFKEMLYEMVGNPKTDKKKLVEVSPYFNIDKIKSPVLIAQGKNDIRVDAASTVIMVKKMKKSGVKVEFMFKENEGHNFKIEENRIEFYKRTEQFLKRYLSGKSSQN